MYVWVKETNSLRILLFLVESKHFGLTNVDHLDDKYTVNKPIFQLLLEFKDTIVASLLNFLDTKISSSNSSFNNLWSCIMTIFLDIAKSILMKELEALRQVSKDSDEGYVNTLLTAAGYGRDANLSQEKRALLKAGVDKVGALTSQENDEITHQALQDQLDGLKETMTDKSDAIGLNMGETEKGLLLLGRLLKDVFNDVQLLGLENTPYDRDPFNQFRFHAALYLAQKKAEQFKLNQWDRITRHPSVSNHHDLQKEKIKLVRETLQECEADLSVLQKEHEHYEQARCKRVLELIGKIRRDNKRLCERYSSRFFKPGPGSLETQMIQAEKEISALLPQDSQYKLELSSI